MDDRPAVIPAPAIRDPERLTALHATRLLDSPPEEAFDRLTGLVRRLLGTPVSLVSLVDLDRQFFKCGLGLAEPRASLRQTPLSHSFCQHVVATEEPLIVNNAPDHPQVCDNLAVRDLGVIAYLGIPLRLPTGHVIGSLCAIDSKPRVWLENDVEVLADLAALVMTEIDLQAQLRVREQAEQALAQQAEALQRSNEALDHFASLASHDLKEPLRTISSFAQLLQQRYQERLDDDAGQFIGFIVDATIRMQDLINDLLAYSRVESQGFKPQPLDLNSVLEQVLAELQTVRTETQATITSDPLPTLLADPTQIHSVLQNLISNAIKFRSQRPPQIHISATAQDGLWRFAVQDNGIGIEATYQDDVFNLFRRLHTRQAYPGTGMGLALCKKIIELHGGTIGVASEPSQGSTFYFTLPA